MQAGNWRDDRIGAADRGENPMFIARLRSGYAFLGDSQFLPGYCVLSAYPEVERLEDLPFAEQTQFLQDMAMLGTAIYRLCRPLRMNYSIYGNSLPILHAHIFPRYQWEPAEQAKGPVWLYPAKAWRDVTEEPDFSQHGFLRDAIRTALSPYDQ